MATRAVVEGMKSRSEGHLVFVSSQAGLLGIYGFSAYSASKFALRGFAEAIHMEVKNLFIRKMNPFYTYYVGCLAGCGVK